MLPNYYISFCFRVLNLEESVFVHCKFNLQYDPNLNEGTAGYAWTELENTIFNEVCFNKYYI